MSRRAISAVVSGDQDGMPGDHGAGADVGVIQIEALLPCPELLSIGQRNPAALISRVTGWPSGTKQ